MSLMGQQQVTVLILDGKRVKFGGISPLTSEQMPGSKIAVFFLKKPLGRLWRQPRGGAAWGTACFEMLL